jgi:hypothetical protein
MSDYLLPCPCGKKTRITAAQAGEQVTCACGKSLLVPTLRGIRQLEPAPTTTASATPGGWTAIHGLVFSSGLAIASVGIILLAIYGLKYAQLGASGYTRDFTEAFVNAEKDRIAKLQPTEALKEWNENLKDGLGEREEPPWIRANKIMAGYSAWLRGASAALIVGCLLAAVALVIPRRHSSLATGWNAG